MRNRPAGCGRAPGRKPRHGVWHRGKPQNALCGVRRCEVARTRARTVYITTNPRSEFDLNVDVAICPDVGPEVLMGSTRMKSGTAQKLVLNMITTTAMVRLGKVYENMMVDLQLTNRKLVERSRRIVMTATGVDYDEAARVLGEAGGHVKTAIVMILVGVTPEEARRRIDGPADLSAARSVGPDGLAVARRDTGCPGTRGGGCAGRGVPVWA